MNPAKPLCALTGIDKYFPGVQALDQARLNVYAGEAMALIGENGAGKSTLMKVLAGMCRKDAGIIRLGDREVTFSSPRASQRSGIAIIHQELLLVPELDVAENIFLGRYPLTRVGTIDRGRLYRNAQRLLDSLEVDFPAGVKVGDLSLARKQMVEIAKALSFAAQVIIMDEPSDALTDKETRTLFRIIDKLRGEGRGIVYISHRLEDVFAMCTRVTVMRDGAFIWEKAVAQIDEAGLIEAMIGRELNQRYPYLAHESGEQVLRVKNLSGHGVQDVSFSLRSGEILALFGLVGAGRTELVKMIYGALRPGAGTVFVKDKRICPRHPHEGLASGIVYVSEDRKKDGLILAMSVRENMTLSTLKRFVRYGRIDRTREKEAVRSYLTRLDIRVPSLDKEVNSLSGGNQQKVAIARGLLAHPTVLILDEPTRGVDVAAKKEIYQLLNALKTRGVAILMVSSDMEEVLGMSDRIATLANGRLTAVFSRAQATRKRLLEAALGAQAA